MSAPAAASAGSGTVDTAGGTIFSAATCGGAAAAITVFNDDVTNNITVAVSGVHYGSDKHTIKPGENITFGAAGTNYASISAVTAAAAAATAAVRWTVVGRR